MTNTKSKAALRLLCLTLPQDPLNTSLSYLPKLFDCLTLTNVNAASMLVCQQNYCSNIDNMAIVSSACTLNMLKPQHGFVTRFCVCLGVNLDAALENLLCPCA